MGAYVPLRLPRPAENLILTGTHLLALLLARLPPTALQTQAYTTYTHLCSSEGPCTGTLRSCFRLEALSSAVTGVRSRGPMWGGVRAHALGDIRAPRSTHARSPVSASLYDARPYSCILFTS